MAFSTHHACFASSCDHLLDPLRVLLTPRLLELSEFTDMVDFYFFFRSAEFARISEYSLKQFAPVGQRELGRLSDQDCVLLAFQRDATKLGDAWLLVAAPLDHNFEARA